MPPVAPSTGFHREIAWFAPQDGSGLCVIDEAFVTTSLTTLVFRKASLVPPIKWNSGMRIGPSRKQDGKYTFMDTAKWLGRTAADLITFPVVSELGTQTPWFKVSGSKVMDASGKLAFEFKVTDHVTDQSVFVNGTELFGLEGAGSNSKRASVSPPAYN